MDKNCSEENKEIESAHPDAGFGIFRSNKSKTPENRTIYSDKLNQDILHYDLVGKGLVLFFSNKDYPQDYCIENDSDIKRFKTCFEKLKFDTYYEYYSNVNKKEVDQILNEVSKRKSTDVSCLIIIVLTHGKSNKQLRAEKDVYDSSIFSKKFEGKLVGVPKLYFIQVCESYCLDKMTEVTDSARVVDRNIKFILPKMADFLEMYFSYSGPCSENKTSSFIEELCEIFETQHHEWHILQMLTYFNNKILSNPKLKSKLRTKPRITYTLTKYMKFNLKEEIIYSQNNAI